jgi:hypothetical protein
MNEYYYQGGVVTKTYGRIWSFYVRNAKAEAADDAKKLAAKHGGAPIVEYWPREYGPDRFGAPRRIIYL